VLCHVGSVAFITQQAHNGGFGGLVGADAFCAEEALRATPPLTGDFCAYLGDWSGYGCGSISYPVVDVNGDTVSHTKFASNTLQNDQFGNPTSISRDFWAGGSPSTTCSDWTTASWAIWGSVGRSSLPGSGEKTIFNTHHAACHQLRPIMCVSVAGPTSLPLCVCVSVCVCVCAHTIRIQTPPRRGSTGRRIRGFRECFHSLRDCFHSQCSLTSHLGQKQIKVPNCVSSSTFQSRVFIL
jgi:hypothetical protein